MGSFTVFLIAVWLVLVLWHWLGGDLLHLVALWKAGGCQVLASFFWWTYRDGPPNSVDDPFYGFAALAMQIGALWWLWQYVRLAFHNYVEW